MSGFLLLGSTCYFRTWGAQRSAKIVPNLDAGREPKPLNPLSYSESGPRFFPRLGRPRGGTKFWSVCRRDEVRHVKVQEHLPDTVNP